MTVGIKNEGTRIELIWRMGLIVSNKGTIPRARQNPFENDLPLGPYVSPFSPGGGVVLRRHPGRDRTSPIRQISRIRVSLSSLRVVAHKL